MKSFLSTLSETGYIVTDPVAAASMWLAIRDRGNGHIPAVVLDGPPGYALFPVTWGGKRGLLRKDWAMPRGTVRATDGLTSPTPLEYLSLLRKNSSECITLKDRKSLIT